MPDTGGQGGTAAEGQVAARPRWGGRWSGNRPRLTLWRMLTAMVVWGLVTLMGGAVPIDVSYWGPMGFDRVFASNIAAAACVMLVAGFLWGELGNWFRAPLAGSFRALWLAHLYLILLMALALAMGLLPLDGLALLAVNCLLIGLSEEMMFRGLFYRALRQKRGIMGAVLLSSLAFGAVHVFNATLTGDLRAALIQSVFAAALGVVLAGMSLRTGSLIWPVAFHALWDMGVLHLARARDLAAPGLKVPEPSLLEMMAPVLFILPLALLSLWQVRRLARHPEALARA